MEDTPPVAPSIVLRFRDLTEDTIARHHEIIRDSGFAWWGWWKKDAERSRRQELERFKHGTPTTIGLYDRSKSRYFFAKVVDCVAAAESIATPDLRATPSYYSSVPLPAWFKLEFIEHIDKSIFEQRFGPTPSGGQTFFTTEELSQDVTQEESGASLPGEFIVHISDLHLGSDFGFPGVRGPASFPLPDLLADDVLKTFGQPGLLVVSGDLTTRADANVLFQDVSPFLTDLCDRLKLDKEFVVIVPGNHDIPLGNWAPYDYSHERPFGAFLRDFYGYERQLTGLYRYKTMAGYQLEFLAINSVRLRRKEERNYGFVEWNLYDDLFPSEHTGAIRMAAMHHHLVTAPSEERIDPAYPEASASTTLDSGAVIEGLQRNGVRLVLHGHQHVPKLAKVARSYRKDGVADLVGLDRDLFVLAAGSAGVRPERLDPSEPHNSYGIIKLSGDELKVETRVFTTAKKPERYFVATL